MSYALSHTRWWKLEETYLYNTLSLLGSAGSVDPAAPAGRLFELWCDQRVICTSSEHSNKAAECRGSGSICYPRRPSLAASRLWVCFFLFLFFSSTIWCYSSGIQSPSPNLSPRHHTLPHPLYSLMHTLKRTGGPRVGCGRGVGGCVRVTEGYIQPPYLEEVCGLWVWPSVDATVSSLSSHFHLSFLFSSWREPIMSYKLTGKIQRWML